MAVPDLPDIEESLYVAIQLSRDADFRRKRADLFEWQDHMVAKGVKPQAIADELSEMTDAYNAAVQYAHKKVLWKYAFMVGGIALGFATGGVLAAGASAALSLLQFAYLDAEPVVEAGNARPAAMFHDIETKIGINM